MARDLEALFEGAMGQPIGGYKMYFDEGGYIIADIDQELYFHDGYRFYKLSSSPYEPCLYLDNKGTNWTTIHYSFSVDMIRRMARDKVTYESVTGSVYDVKRVCRFMAYAANNCADTEIGLVEGMIAIEDLKGLGAYSPETAIFIESVGLRTISESVMHSKKNKERIVETKDGRFFVKIKE